MEMYGSVIDGCMVATLAVIVVVVLGGLILPARQCGPLASLGGWLCFLFIAVHGAHGWCQGHWQFNANLVPEAIIAPDGRHTDGSLPNEFDLASWRSGKRRDDLAWLMYAGVAGAAVYCWWDDRRQERLRRHQGG